jgi:hypothetical protein
MHDDVWANFFVMMLKPAAILEWLTTAFLGIAITIIFKNDNPPPLFTNSTQSKLYKLRIYSRLSVLLLYYRCTNMVQSVYSQYTVSVQ